MARPKSATDDLAHQSARGCMATWGNPPITLLIMNKSYKNKKYSGALIKGGGRTPINGSRE